MTRPWCFVLWLALSNSSWGAAPNIVLILADDLGYGDVGCYGSTAIPTPAIDQMAREGIRLTHCYAPASTCTPTRYAIMTGEYAWRQRQRQTTILDGDAPLAISPGRATLPEVLRRAGYQTTLIGKWHLGIGNGDSPVDFNGHVGPGPLEVGFDEAFYIPATVDRVPCVFIENHSVYQLDPADPIEISYRRRLGDEPTGRERPDLLKYKADDQHSDTIVNGISRIGYMTGGQRARWIDEEISDVLADRAARFIQRERDRPFFLLLGTHDPHVPHAPHPRFVGQSRCGARGDTIVQTDELVKNVLEAIAKAGLDRQTMVILTSDNGPTVFDGYFDGSVEAAGGHQPAGNLRGGKYLVYEGGCRVPCIVRWPGTVPAGDSHAMFTLTDLLCSLAAIGGVQGLPDDIGQDGMDLSAVLLDPQASSRRNSAVLQGISQTYALLEGEWKFIPANSRRVPANWGRQGDGRDTRFAQVRIERDTLFHLRQDPAESTNVVDQYPQQAAKLAARLHDILAGR